MKELNIIGNVVQVGAILYFASSFFVKDSEIAVKHRWQAVGLGALGYGLTVVAKMKQLHTK